MNTIKHTLFFVVIATMLSGCSLMGNKKEPVSTTDDVINKNIELAISSIQKTQAELYQYGAINEKAVGITGGIYHDNVRIDMNWNGDAYELLSQMAKQRSYAFRSSGSRLPLPVMLKVSHAEYKDVINSIQTQIGYRAAIVIDNSSRVMTLNYNVPNIQESSNARVIIKRAISDVSNTPAPVPQHTLQGSNALRPTNNGSGLLNGGSPPIGSGAVFVKVGDKCIQKGVLSRDGQGKPVSCTNGRWRLM